MIRSLGYSLDVSQAQEQLKDPTVWNSHDDRRRAYAHKGVDDIWVRYAEGGHVKDGPHESVWYPVVHRIPAVWSLVRKVLRRYPGKLGGVLITRIPPGGRVEPHIDRGWHAGHYEKIAVQIKGDAMQAFRFDDCSLSPLDGDVYTFQNDVTHWVTNDSDRERITLIICIRSR